MSKFLIVGDVHFEKGLSMGKPGVGGLSNSRLEDTYKLMNWVYEQAIDNSVSNIIFAGDIFEHPKPEYTVMEFFVKWIKKCESSKINVHIIFGNHDIRRSGSSYTSALDVIRSAEFPLTKVYRDISTVGIGDVAITMMPYRDRRAFNKDSNMSAMQMLQSMLDHERDKITNYKYKVVVGHLTIEGALPSGDEIDDTLNSLNCPVSMFAGYDYVWMGHIHKPQVRAESNPFVAHVGSLDLSDVGEVDDIKNLILFDTSLPDNFTTIAVPSRPIRRIKIGINQGEDATVESIIKIDSFHKKNSLHDSLVAVEICNYPESLPVNKELICNHIYGLGAFHIFMYSESRAAAVKSRVNRSEVAVMGTPRQAVKIYADKLGFEAEQDKTTFIEMCNSTIDCV